MFASIVPELLKAELCAGHCWFSSHLIPRLYSISLNNELSNTDHHCCLWKLSVSMIWGHLCNDQENYPGHLFWGLQQIVASR